jgi:hypothetical protein
MLRIGFKLDLEPHLFMGFVVYITDDFPQGRHSYPIHSNLGREKFAVGAGGIHATDITISISTQCVPMAKEQH